jgi:hypothetical protein
MKLVFEQSGGFAGLFRRTELDTAAMAPREAAELRELVKQAGLRSLHRAEAPQAADLTLYEIHVETDEGGHWEASFDDQSIPREAVPLLLFLRLRSHPSSPE